MTIETQVWTLDELILADKVKLGRGNIISKKDIRSFPGNFPIYSSAREKNGTFGYYGKYMFDEELITWSIDGGGRLFYRPRHKFSVTNVGGTLRILDNAFLDCRYLHLVLTHLHSKIRFDWVYKAHPSVIRTVYNEIPIPSLEKQREIVEKLDSTFVEIDLLERNLESVDEKSNELLHSLLSDSFAYPVVGVEPSESLPDEPATAKLVALRDVVSFEKKQGSFDLAYVGLEDIESNTGLHLGSIEPRIVKSKTFAFTSEHLLYGRLRPYLNKVLLPNFDGHCSTEIFPIKVSREILREYLFYWFRLQRTVEAINETCTGARMPRANMEAVLDFEIPLPPIEIQSEIVDKLDSTFAEIETLKAQIKTEKDYVVALRQSLLSSAFLQEEAVA
jgi:type I restriction enzyme S subunit